MRRFINKLETGEVHKRDRWQFEIKSDFFPSETGKPILYTQEYYFFIPGSLQVNRETYPKESFYNDLTNLIRYKTPSFTFLELLDTTNKRSPLQKLFVAPDTEEMKLFGNVFRSTLRNEIAAVVKQVKARDRQGAENSLTQIAESLQIFYRQYNELKGQIDSSLALHLDYTQEFIFNTIEYYLTGVLEVVRRSFEKTERKLLCDTVCAILDAEQETGPPRPKTPSEDEYILYRGGLLNKYMLDALLLNTPRSSLDRRFRTLISSFSAGLAMCVFFVLFIWQGDVFIINSIPFITATVLLYILKDRMKEELKFLSYRQFTRWFSDFSTKIRTADNSLILGKMSESFAFVNESKIPEEIEKTRNREFHEVFEKIKRTERVIYYKKKIKLLPYLALRDLRRTALNIIFRFNINRFVRKADNPEHTYLSYDRKTHSITHRSLPKVYHLNMILKNTFQGRSGKEITEIKKYRIVLNKNGIVRIETVTTSSRQRGKKNGVSD